MELRPYQKESVESVRRDWQTHKSLLGTMATGAGKTNCFLALLTDAHARNPHTRSLILAHRKELIEQPRDRLYEFWPEWQGKAGIVMAEQNECYTPMVIATVQTLSSDKRLQQVLAFGAFDYLIVDESHHVCADTYLALYEKLLAANPNMKTLGVTATPIRADGKGLRTVLEKESFHYGIREMVSQGWLVPPRWLAIQTGISLAGVQSREGDYVQKQLADVYETENCFDLVIETHRKYADGRKALAFTASVDGAYVLARKFNEAGIAAEAADGTTAKAHRADILRRFRTGQLDVLVNVGLYTEGLDVPPVSCIHQVRPTKSDGLYLQMCGRALRTFPGKQDALILDYAPVEVRNVCMLGDVLGVDARKDAYLREDAEEGEVVGGFTFDGQVKWLKGDPMEIVSRQLDYLDLSPFSWFRQGGWLTLGLGRDAEEIDRTLAISPPDREGLCALWLVTKDKEWTETVEMLRADTFESLSDLAQGYVDRHGSQAIIGKARQWRQQPASDKQAQFAQRLGVWRAGMSKGDCAQAITHTLALKTISRRTRMGQTAMVAGAA